MNEQGETASQDEIVDETTGDQVAPKSTSQPSEDTVDVAKTTADVDDVPTDATPVAQPVDQPTAKAPGKRRVTVALLAVVAVLMMAVAAVLLMNQGSAEPGGQSTNQQSASEPVRLGVAVTVADGTVEYAKSDDWKALTTDGSIKLVEGMLVRTGDDSRAVLTLDDGSAVRLDANTVVRLVSLIADAVVIEQIEGNVYSRVVPSDRKYTIETDGTTYQALGTAFMTMKNEDTDGVQVFESSVKVGGVESAVPAGKQYYVANQNSALHGKLVGIDLADLVSNKFVAWNVAEDKKDTNFRDKLGVLDKFDQEVAEQAAKRKAEAEAKRAAQEAARQAAEKARQEAERKAREAAADGLTVKLSDGGIFWEYSKEAKYGFKVLYSAKNANPLLYQSGTEAIYVDHPRVRFLYLPKDMKKSRSYYVRVCLYEPNNPSGPCPVYSNTLKIRR